MNKHKLIRIFSICFIIYYISFIIYLFISYKECSLIESEWCQKDRVSLTCRLNIS